MATSPMMQGYADSEMPEDEAGTTPATSEGQVAELCIGVMADGTLTVYKETGEEAAESESPRQPAASIGEALKMLLDLYRAMSQGGGEDAFKAGFASDDDRPTQRAPMGRGMA